VKVHDDMLGKRFDTILVKGHECGNREPAAVWVSNGRIVCDGCAPA
jgi:hypothetical protein